ncbi:FAD dependent oxidoreductase [Truncatella angustata]|uniref:FAD dependent oxidoreductase n=1 Tax=Truncatella angustata TaxID=152316 RepID=A0A9P8UAP5_9PEZI|nr:FAD dependent oxidoreductase [Truncatella angustata]KAH6639921.1 FAD dependent oxidoreductase [Truncatella angustata]
MGSEVPGPFPVANATASYWRSEPHTLDEHRSTPELPDRSDIVVIGAGFTGATAAYYLLEDNGNPRPSVTLLEAREACSGATGRNGGHLRPDIFLQVLDHIQLYGTDVANEVAQFEVANAKAIKDLIHQEHIECELRECTTADVFLDDQVADRLKQQYDELLAVCPTMKDVTYHGLAEANELTSVKGAKAAFTFSGATVWPYKLVLGLLEKALRNGLNLQTRTPVVNVSETADHDGYWSVSTPRGNIKARQVVFATNAYTGGILPQYSDSIIPVRGLMGRIVPAQGASSIKPLLHSSATRYSGYGYDYHGVQPDGSLIVGGAFVPYSNHPLRYNTADDSTLYEGSEELFDGWLQRSFDGWETTATRVEETWTGVMGYTSDQLPHIGKVPGKTGQFVCAGFNGHGMPNVFLCAKSIVQMVQTGCSFSETGVPTCYETSFTRLQKKRQQ